MSSSSSLFSLAGKLFKPALPSPLPRAATPYRCFSAKATTKGKAKEAAVDSPRTAAKSAPAAPAQKKPKKTIPQPLYKVSSGLSGVLQVSETTRPDALKRLWIYIKAHNLQSASDKTQIVCDATLKKAFGQDNLKFSEVLKCMSPHLTKKV